MPNDIFTSPAILADIERLRESLAAAAESDSPSAFAAHMGELARIQSVEIARLTSVLRNEVAVPPRKAVSICAAEDCDLGKDTPRATVFALDHIGDVWRLRGGNSFWERLAPIPTPAEFEQQERERHEKEMAQHRALQERGFR